MSITAKRKLLSENPKYKVGDTIQINTEYKGAKDLKKGKYIIISFRDSIVGNLLYNKIYEFKSVRKNSTYIYCFSQEFIEQNSELI